LLQTQEETCERIIEKAFFVRIRTNIFPLIFFENVNTGKTLPQRKSREKAKDRQREKRKRKTRQHGPNNC
jgi:hypothetical protein